jgi:hypothetical protein
MNNRSGKALSCCCFVCEKCSAGFPASVHSFARCSFCGIQNIKVASLDVASVPKEIGDLLSNGEALLTQSLATLQFQNNHYKRIASMAAERNNALQQHLERERLQQRRLDHVNTPPVAKLMQTPPSTPVTTPLSLPSQTGTKRSHHNIDTTNYYDEENDDFSIQPLRGTAITDNMTDNLSVSHLRPHSASSISSRTSEQNNNNSHTVVQRKDAFTWLPPTQSSNASTTNKTSTSSVDNINTTTRNHNIIVRSLTPVRPSSALGVGTSTTSTARSPTHRGSPSPTEAFLRQSQRPLSSSASLMSPVDVHTPGASVRRENSLQNCHQYSRSMTSSRPSTPQTQNPLCRLGGHKSYTASLK